MYFEVLGENGYPALFFFLMMWLYTWRDASWIIKRCTGGDLLWARRLAAMIQVSIVGHVVGGAFLANAYFEPVFYFIVLVVALRHVVETQLASRERVSSLAPEPPTTRNGFYPERG
jgi:hypothetical protein